MHVIETAQHFHASLFFILGYLKVKTEKKKKPIHLIYTNILIVLEMFHCFKWTF